MMLLIAILLVVVGLVGVVVPAVPGTILIFAGLLLGAWSDRFVRVGVPTMVLLGMLTVATYFVDIAMMALVTCLAIGFLNGYLVMRTGIPSFLITLGTFFILQDDAPIAEQRQRGL